MEEVSKVSEEPLEELEKGFTHEEGGYSTVRAEKSDFRKQKEPTLRWIYGSVKTALQDSAATEEEVREAVDEAVETVQSGDQKTWLK